MPAAPRVSVLIGAWNNASTIEGAIASILGQSLADLELVVVDDGSTDTTAEVVDGIDDRRLRRLALPHMGISRSLNRGLAAARAPIVAVQDADDWSEPERLDRQLAVLAARPEVAVVGTRMREVDESGGELAPRTTFFAGDVNALLMRANPIPNSCAAFRRTAALEAGGYDPRYLYAMDWDLWLRIAERHTVHTLDEVLATRRMGSTNVAARKERAQTAETVVMRLQAMRRRRSARGLPNVMVGAIAYATPLAAKRARRRRLGQAP
jgi:glycosyltransferase involved in cell wall biosynthesis